MPYMYMGIHCALTLTYNAFVTDAVTSCEIEFFMEFSFSSACMLDKPLKIYVHKLICS